MTIVDAWVAPSLLVGGILLGATFVAGWWARRSWFPNALLVVVPLFLAVWCFATAQHFCTQWTASRATSGPDGREYALLEEDSTPSFPLIGRLTARERISRTFEVMATPEIGFRYYAAVVRPSDAATDPARVIFTPDGHAVGLRTSGAYAVARPGDGGALGFDDLRRLSPFVLLDAKAVGSDRDVDSIVADIVRCLSGADTSRDRFLRAHPDDAAAAGVWGTMSGVPTEASLLDALGHANPWVRAAARRIIEAGGAEMYPEATKRIADAPK